MKHYIKILIACMVLANNIYAQQDAGFSQYFFNQLYVNPAYAGSTGMISGCLVNRNQWVGLPGSPMSQSLTLHAPINDTKVGLGFQVYHDKAGPLQTTALQGTYAYHIQLGKAYKLSLGLSGLYQNLQISYSDIYIDNKADPSFGTVSSRWVPDANFGAYLYKDRFYLGASVNHLLEPRFKLQDSYGQNSARFARHYYLTSGMVVKLNENFNFRPSALLKYVAATPLDIGLNASFIYKEKIFGGIGTRSSKAANVKGINNQLIAIVEYAFDNGIRIGYSFDYYINSSYNFNGTHEIMLGWDINTNKTKMRSPRFF